MGNNVHFPSVAKLAKNAKVCERTVQMCFNSNFFSFFFKKVARDRQSNRYEIHPIAELIFSLCRKKGVMKKVHVEFEKFHSRWKKFLDSNVIANLEKGLSLLEVIDKLSTKKGKILHPKATSFCTLAVLRSKLPKGIYIEEREKEKNTSSFTFKKELPQIKEGLEPPTLEEGSEVAKRLSRRQKLWGYTPIRPENLGLWSKQTLINLRKERLLEAPYKPYKPLSTDRHKNGPVWTRNVVGQAYSEKPSTDQPLDDYIRSRGRSKDDYSPAGLIGSFLRKINPAKKVTWYEPTPVPIPFDKIGRTNHDHVQIT